MSGVALIYTPSALPELGLQVFYPTKNNYLAVAQRSSSSKSDPKGNPVYEVASNAPTGPLTGSTFLAAAPISGVNLVVGITAQAGTTPTDNDVAIVSPVYQVIDSIKAKTNFTLAMCSDGDESAWVYYLDFDANQKIVLKEYEFNSQSMQGLTTVRGILANSALASLYNPTNSKRFVFYQDNDSHKIYQYETSNPDKDPEHLPTQSANGNGAALAAVCVPDNGKQYLYYTDDEYKIWRLQKTADGSWGSLKDIGNRAISATGQLAAVHANGINHLLYVPSGEKKSSFEHYKDHDL